MRGEVEFKIEDADPPREQPDETPANAAAAPPEDAEKPQMSDLSGFLKHTRAVLPAAVLGLFLLALIACLYFAKSFVMPIAIATVLAFLLTTPIKWLTRIHVPRAIASIFVISAFFALMAFAATRLLQPAAEWAAKAPETMSNIEQKFRKIIHRAQRLSRAAAQVENMTKQSNPDDGTQQVEVKQPVLIKAFFVFTKSFITGLIETVVLIFFMLVPGHLFMSKLIGVLPTLKDKKTAVGIVDEVQHSVSAFLFTITVINAVLGTIVGVSAWAIGVPNAALWGTLAGLLNYVPYFGPITGVSILAVVGFATFDDSWRAVMPAGIYLALHTIESNFVTPWILGRRLTLNPLIIFISLMFWMFLWGIPGALLSVPMLMMLKIFCDHFKPLAPIGELLSG